jgi:peptide methionine sulfoxide reductase MsrA
MLAELNYRRWLLLVHRGLCFLSLDGVTKVESGYSGGTVKNPSYKEVCSGETGHAECVKITYDPKKDKLR